MFSQGFSNFNEDTNYLGDLSKMQHVWGKTQDSAVPTSPPVMLRQWSVDHTLNSKVLTQQVILSLRKLWF